jgi:glycosyltransferase involved in cell wall biosynthesis
VVSIGQTRRTVINQEAGSLLEPLRTLVGALTNTVAPGIPVAPSTQIPTKSIVIAASPNLLDIVPARRIAERSNLPLVIAFHHLTPAPWRHPRRRGGVIRCAGAWLVNQAALVITKVCRFVPSIDQVRILSESGWRFSGPVLHDEIFLDSYPEPDTLRAHDRPIDVCFVSRLSPMKGLFDLVSIWAEVHRRLPTACLVVGGDFESPQFERQIRLAIEKVGLTEFIRLRGHLSDDDKRDLLAASKLFAYPSYEEGWSLAVMEAAAYGCVPIVYDLPAYDYLGSAIPRVPVGSATLFADRVVNLLGNNQTRDKIAASLEVIPPTFTAERTASNQIAFFRARLL